MDPIVSLKNETDQHLDILGQLPGLKIYTQMCLCYSVPDSSSPLQIINTLRAGLERLSVSFPWIAARVDNEGASEGGSGVWGFKPLEKIPRLTVKNLTDDPLIPSMDAMREANFPMTMLDESIIAPIMTIPARAPEDQAAKDSPVFALQASFIKGGLLLTFVAEHRTMDGIGQGQILYLFSKACRGEDFTAEELSSGNLCRKDLIPLLSASYKPGSELDHQIIKAVPTSPASTNIIPPPTSPTCTWANFSFSPTSLNTLKSLAMVSISIPTVKFISTDDAITAFIWQSIMRSRLSRIDFTTEIKFARAVDVRDILNIPSTYPGMVQNMTYHTFPLQKMVESPLGAIASNLRHAIDPTTSTLLYDTRSLATQIDRTPNKSIFSLAASLELPKDLMLSSWMKLNCYDLDFGLGVGKPVAVRRPKFSPFESLGYILPRTPEGEVVLALCLRDEDLERLRDDEEWKKFARYIG